MASSDQETPRRSSQMEMYSSAAAAAAAGESIVTASGDDSSPLPVLADEVLHEMRPSRTTSIDDDAVAASSLWAFILEDILGIILRFLPCLADRAAVRSVCRHWRAAAHGHSLPPPLPLLVLPKFRLFSFSTQGAIGAMRHGCMPEEVAIGNVRCVGSCEGWLLVARPCEDAVGRERFLVNAFSHEVICLPRLSASYCTTSGDHPWIANDDPKQYSWSLEHVVLSAPPGSATKCTVAGFSYSRHVPGFSDSCGLTGLMLWQPGMKTWYVYHSRRLDSLSDLVFHQGKLYMLNMSWYHDQSPWLFTFTLGEDEHGVNVSGLEGPVSMPPFPCPDHADWVPKCNLVLWRGCLVVIVRSVDAHTLSQTKKVDVFALDLSINPCEVTKIDSFDGDCIFVDRCRCTSFPAGSYEGVQGDCIYFIRHKKRDALIYETTVYNYNMRDGTVTVKPCTAELLSSNAEDNLADPLWMFPPE